jgi:dipeptidyl aminopeptidase/acylaminoacyl peptidase
MNTPRLSPHNLLLYPDAHGQPQPVTTTEHWLRRRASILAGMHQIMGPLPGPEKRSPLDIQTLEETPCQGYTRKLITYQSEPHCRTPAYLLLPDSPTPGLPGILALHGTDDTHGHKVVVFPGMRANRQYAHELAQRGHTVIAPAYPGLAQYKPDFRALGYISDSMKAIWDNIRALDLLQSLPNHAPTSFAAIGHSLGGHNSVFTAVFDTRITTIISSCGLDSFSDYYHANPDVWNLGKGWTSDRYMPLLANYHHRLHEIPFDFPELIAALAPRNCFISAPLSDSNFQWQSVDRLTTSARAIYNLYNAPQNLTVIHPDAEHDFPDHARQQAYAFLNRSGE